MGISAKKACDQGGIDLLRFAERLFFSWAVNRNSFAVISYKTSVWFLNPAAKCAILSIEKGKAIEAALPLKQLSYNLI